MATNNWTGNDAPFNWDDAGNWSLGTVPGSTDDVVIDMNNGPVASGPSAATTIASLTINDIYGVSLDIHNLTVTGATALTSSSNGIIIKGGAYHDNISVAIASGVTGNVAVDFSQGANHPTWGSGITLSATGTCVLAFFSSPPAVTANDSTVIIQGAGQTVYSSNIVCDTLLILPAAAYDIGKGVSAWTVSRLAYVYSILTGTAHAALTLTSSAQGCTLDGAGASGIALTDNRSGSGVSAQSISEVLLPALVAAIPAQLTTDQIQSAILGRTDVTMPVNSDGSLDCVVTNYGAGMSFSEQLAGVYGATAGVDSDNNLTLLGPQPMFFLLPNGTVVSE